MTRRCLAIVLMVGAVVATPAGAQTGGGGNPFGPLPQPAPPTPEAPEPEKIKAPSSDDDALGGTAFWLIIGTTGAIFALVAFLITRDMRRTVGARRGRKRRFRRSGRPAADAARAIASNEARHEPGSHKARAKAQKRAKTKAARKQRRKSGSR